MKSKDMLQRLNNKEEKEAKKKWGLLFFVIIFLIWICIPPRNKPLQVCYWGYNIKAAFIKASASSKNYVYKIHRNTAVYLTKLYDGESPKMQKALKEIDMAITKFPQDDSLGTLKHLYKDRAYIKYYSGDYKGAINDFVLAEHLEYNDRIIVAMLLKKLGYLDNALVQCQAAALLDDKSYETFACIASVQFALGEKQAAIYAMDYAIEKQKRNAKAYVERARYKKYNGDKTGSQLDLTKARSLDAYVKTNYVFAEDIIRPKRLQLEIRN